MAERPPIPAPHAADLALDLAREYAIAEALGATRHWAGAYLRRAHAAEQEVALQRERADRAEAACAELRADVKALQLQVERHCKRIADQSEQLSRNAERQGVGRG